jgi:mannose-6-phosphate isomerase-like protein (cupin superfamily)
MAGDRPPLVGEYDLVTDYESDEMTVRIFRMTTGTERIEPHVHQRSAQVYVPLVGQVTVSVDGVETIVNPYHVLRVAAGRAHSARPTAGTVIVMNISVPPLRADDQVPTMAVPETPDLALPAAGGDVED